MAKVSSELTTNAFVIETVDDLTNLSFSDIDVIALKGDANNVESTLGELKAYYWTRPCNFVQTKDIAAVSFANPIGDTTAFTGTYNGQNYTVSSLTVIGNTAYSGMFGLFTGASIKNLNVEALTLTGATTGSVGLIANVDPAATTVIDNITLNNVDVSAIGTAANVAGLIGVTGANEVTVSNVSITFKTDTGIKGTAAAGLIGTAGINTSIANANVTTQGTGTITGTTHASGLVGMFNGTTIDNADVTLSAALSATGVNSFVGGIAANVADATISNSNVTFADVASASAATSKVGGIAGNVSGTSTLSSNKVTAAKLISAETAGSYAGGIVGYAVDANVSVTNNSFISAVASPSHAVSATAGAAAGCIAGNETGLAASLYGKNGTTSTTIAGAIEYPISGNTCSCGQHAHPVNANSNDFMAGKNHTLPLLSSILPVHNTDVSSATIGNVSIYPQITMTFDKPMNTSAVEAAFKLYRHDDAGAVTTTTYADGFVFTWDTDNQRVQATPKTALEFSRAYTVELTNATAKDIYTNSVAGIKLIAGVGTDNGTIIRWSFKTTRGDKPQISPITFERDRRTLTGKFSANVTVNGADITASATQYVGIYYSLAPADPNPVNTTGWGDKLHDPAHLLATPATGHNYVVGSANYSTGEITCTLSELNLTDVNTPYYLVPYVITTDGFIHFGNKHKVVVHPWNLRDGNNTASELAKVSSELTTNAFVIETVDDLTNLSFSYIDVTALKGDANNVESTLAELTAYYWTQPCNFVQTKNIDVTVTFANPIGTATADPFKGSYNGQNYTIADLNITGNTTYAGMFGVVDGATLANINISDVIVAGPNNSANVGSLVGSVLSTAKASTITNVNVSTVDLSAVTAAANIGGLVGIAGGTNAITISNSSVTVDTTISSTNGSVGGVLGKADSANVTVSDNLVSYAAAGHVVASTSGTAGCIVGNETGNATYQYSADGTIYTTEAVGAIDFAITGNRCSCTAHHTHPQNVLGNDFMAGKYYTKPMVTTISPDHVASVISTVVGTTGVLDPIVVTFDKPMDTTSFASSFAVFKGNDAGTGYDATPLNNAATFNFVWDAANQKVSVTPKVAFEFNRAYKVVVTKATAIDIYDNPIDKTETIIAGEGDQPADPAIEWTFKTVRGTTPNFSVVELVRNRREVTANFSATVIGGQNISLTDAFV
ncbi:MAG: Ig-like domain-containing protein, partial [Parabacteroides sp.]|nr:Ig-like domain-containing protein [Parabacteroides sp.]